MFMTAAPAKRLALNSAFSKLRPDRRISEHTESQTVRRYVKIPGMEGACFIEGAKIHKCMQERKSESDRRS